MTVVLISRSVPRTLWTPAPGVTVGGAALRLLEEDLLTRGLDESLLQGDEA